MNHSKRLGILMLGGVAALSLMAPLKASAQQTDIQALVTEIREQIPYTVKFYRLDREGKEQEVSSARLMLPEDAREISVEDQKKLLEPGWVLVKEEPFPISEGELKIQVKAQERDLKVNYVTADGKVVHTEVLTVAMDKDKVVATDLREIPQGHTLVNHVDSPITADTQSIDILVQAQRRELKVNYVTADGKLIHTEVLTVAADQKKVTATDLREIPKGYTLVNHVDSPIDADTQSIDIAVQPERRELKVNYVTSDGKLIHTEVLSLTLDQKKVTATDLKELPKGYSLVNKVEADLLPTTTAIEVLVQKDQPVPTEKVISVHYKTADGKKVHTSSLTVAIDAKSVEVSALKDIPNGYVLVSKGSLTIDGSNAIHPVVELKKKDENKDDVPKTGDPTPVLMGLSGLSLGGAALVGGLKKKIR